MTGSRMSRLMVIDADVARAAGETEHPTSIACRTFLEQARTICHRVIVTPAIDEQWTQHESIFFYRWKGAMESRGKLIDQDPPRLSKLRKAIEDDPKLSLGQRQRRKLLDDIHLLEAACSADKIIVSMDETAKTGLSKIADRDKVLKSIAWVNPCRQPKEVAAWLRAGAPNKKSLRIGFKQKTK